MFEKVDVQPAPSQAPSALYAMIEFPRVLVEMFSLRWAWPLLASLPRGNGQPVLVLPGFGGGDDSTLLLRQFLTRLGYTALPWLLGQNNGHPDLLARLGRRYFRLASTFDQRISIVGQSLGGIFGREIARQFPNTVRSVITLGSPFGATDPTHTHPMMTRLFEMMSGTTVEEMRQRMPDTDPREPLELPTTSIYSRTDGVVHWTACLAQEDELSENIEVVGSHTGMAHHPAVLHAIADRLVQERDTWQKFDRTLGMRPYLFPEPGRLDAVG